MTTNIKKETIKSNTGIPIAIRLVLLALWIFLMIAIAWFSNQEADISTEQSLSIGKLICRLVVDGYTDLSESSKLQEAMLIDKLVRKTAHFCEYAALGLLSLNSSCLFLGIYCQKKKRANYKPFIYILFALIWCFVYACTDEFHQYFIPGRYCSFWDVLLDTSGALTGIMFFYLIFRKHLLYKK